MTPDELRTKQRERELAGLLTSGQQQMEHDLAEQKAMLDETRRRHEEEFELERRRHDQALAQMQQKLTHMAEQFQQQLQQQKLMHDQMIRTTSFQHAVGEAARLKDALGVDDSAMPTIIAGAIGERTISETADTLNAERERQQEQEAEDAAQEREWRRESARYERQITRENARDAVQPGSRKAQDPGLSGRRRREPRPGRPPERRISHERASERGQAAGERLGQRVPAEEGPG